jgi:hypothetical protein
LRCRRNDQAKRHGGGNSGNRRSSSHHQSCPGEISQDAILIPHPDSAVNTGNTAGKGRWARPVDSSPGRRPSSERNFRLPA